MRTIDGIRLTARREVVERTRERSFLISTVITLLILAGVIVIPKLLGGGPTTFDVGLVGGASQRLGPALAAQAPAAGVEVRVRSVPSAATAEAEVRDDRLALGIMLASTVGVVVLASRLYAGAILRTGTRVKLRDAWRSARQPA